MGPEVSDDDCGRIGCVVIGSGYASESVNKEAPRLFDVLLVIESVVGTLLLSFVSNGSLTYFEPGP